MVQEPLPPFHRKPWEAMFDTVVATAADERLSDALAQLKRLRAWQRRQNRGGLTNHEWHDAELLWLEGVVLEKAGDSTRAAAVWGRLARLFTHIAPREWYFLPKCAYCARRELGFAPNWFNVAMRLRERAHDLAATSALFRQYVLGEPGALVAQSAMAQSAMAQSAMAQSAMAQSASVPSANAESATESPADEPKGRGGSSVSAATLRSKRENIRLASSELDQPSVVVHLSEEYVKLDPLNGGVWLWYGQGLADLGRYEEAATAFQTARGLATSEDLRGVVLMCQGDLALDQGRLTEAEARYQEAVEACEDRRDWPWIMLGRVRFKLGALADAEQCFRAAVDAKGKNPATALYELGLVLRARSSLFEARRVLRQAIAHSSHVDIHEALADVERAIRLQSRNGRRLVRATD